jgi:RNA polymerase sigma factor (sigma-70 family)
VPATPEQWAAVLEHGEIIGEIARGFHHRMRNVVDVEDLEQAGRIGALAAIRNLDPSLDPDHFLLRVYVYIRGAMIRHLRAQAAPIRLPPPSDRRRLRRIHPDSPAARAADEVARATYARPDDYLEVYKVPGRDGPDPITTWTVRDVVATLPPEEREVIEAHYGINRPPRTIAAIGRAQGRSAVATYVRQRRAQQRLRERLRSSISPSPQ